MQASKIQLAAGPRQRQLPCGISWHVGLREENVPGRRAACILERFAGIICKGKPLCLPPPHPTNRHLVEFLVYNIYTVVVQTVAANSASDLAAFQFMDLASTAFAA